MRKIKYYSDPDNKRRYAVIEADERFADGYQVFQREEWRVEKERGRCEALYSLTAMEDGHGYQAADKRNGDPLAQIIERADKTERLSKFRAALSSLTGRQMQVTLLLYEGKTPVEIAESLGVSKQSVNDIKKAVQKKFEHLL